MWSGPRNVSTALMYSFAQRPDTFVLDEPLYGHYLKVTDADHPGKEEVLASMELDGELVVEQFLSTDFEKPLLFIKNMGHHMEKLNWQFLEKLDHLFLIRDPHEMLPSMVKQYPYPEIRDTALKAQWELYQYLEQRGQLPIVIDSKELLLDPAKILSQVCEAYQVPYFDGMVKWEPGARPEDGIWAKYWYHNVHKSSGFARYQPKNEVVREDLLPLLEECKYYYQKLYQYAIKA